ncbi:MAG: SDR family oxidoreductase [Allorhizobium sp.]
MAGSIAKTALVTGAAKRLGRAIALDLAADGFAIAVHANTSIDEAQALAADIRMQGGKAGAFQADLRDIGETSALVGKVHDELGPIGVLVNNASVFLDDSAETFNPETFSAHFDIHVRAPSILAAGLVGQLPEDGCGLIVNIIDQRVWALTPRFYSYTLSKSALWTATRTLAQALAPKIRVNAIGPGPSFRSDRQTDADFQAQLDGLLLQQGPALAEFGRTIRFLFDTPSITGQMIALDGGQHLTWRVPGETEIVE